MNRSGAPEWEKISTLPAGIMPWEVGMGPLGICSSRSHLGPATAHLYHLSPPPSLYPSLSGSHGGPGRGEVPLATSFVTVAATLPYCPSRQVHEPFSELKPFSSQGFQKETILDVTKLLDVSFPGTLFLQCYMETQAL